MGSRRYPADLRPNNSRELVGRVRLRPGDKARWARVICWSAVFTRFTQCKCIPISWDYEGTWPRWWGITLRTITKAATVVYEVFKINDFVWWRGRYIIILSVISSVCTFMKFLRSPSYRALQRPALCTAIDPKNSRYAYRGSIGNCGSLRGA